MSNVFVVPGRNSLDLAKRIAKECSYPLAEVNWQNFSDGESKPQYKDNIRGAYLYIVNSTNSPASNLYDVLLLTDAAIRASAKSVIAVIPYFGGQRQERKDKGRVPITAELNIRLLEAAGVYKVIAMDLHANAIQGFFKRFDHLYASYLFVPYIKTLKIENLVAVSPDAGGAKRASKYAEYFNVGFCMCYKDREDDVDNLKDMILLGDVENKDVIIFDDLIDTAGTINACISILKEKGAKSVKLFATHPIFSGRAYERIKALPDVPFVVTDTLPLSEKFLELPNLTVLSSHKLLAEVIRRDVNDESISSLFVF